MSLNQWNLEAIKQLKKETGQCLLKDEQTLVEFSRDFGGLIQSTPQAVCIPQQLHEIESLIQFAAQHQLPLTLRGNGLSQSGQSLALRGGLSLSMQQFNQVLAMEEDSIWVEATTPWKDLLAQTLKQGKAPYVLPYNCNLSVGGVLSVGGMGAASFKYGSAAAFVAALEVIDGTGLKQTLFPESDLFNACLAGQGKFAVITKACIRLRKVLPQVKTCFLVYTSMEAWLEDADKLKKHVDYMELFCSPSIQGARIKSGKPAPLAQWLYGLHCSKEYDQQVPSTEELLKGADPWKLLHVQEEPIASYYLRHDFRFAAMKDLGQWTLLHPWYECFIEGQVLKAHLPLLLEELPLYYANMVHILPVAPHQAGFLMFPEGNVLYSLMILNPGIHPLLKESCLQVVKDLDQCFIPQGGKRYLSGFLGEHLSELYWSTHFGPRYASWLQLKKQFDPQGIFTSKLYEGA